MSKRFGGIIGCNDNITYGRQYNVGEKKPTVILDTNGYVIPVAYSFIKVCMYGQHFQQSMIWINRVSLPRHHLKK